MTKREKETRRWISQVSAIKTGLDNGQKHTVNGQPTVFMNPAWSQAAATDLSNLIDWLIELDHEEMKNE